ncbi:MAG: hypothetical protein CME64_14250 [Halobacteriovoraceae bacterium]|nr:hypothetical protein [Halobacteriovoraceae bacterium]
MIIKRFIALLFIRSSSLASYTVSKFDINTRASSLKLKSGIEAYASSDLTEKLKLFDSDKIGDIKEGFEKSLESPTIARANFKLSISHNKNVFSYKRQYFALAQAQNPVFPQLKLTQFNDHEISFSRTIKWKRLSLVPTASWVFRRGKIETMKAEQLMEGDFDFNPEAGSPYQFLSLGSVGAYSLDKDKHLIFNINGINVGESIVPEQYYMLGFQKSFISNSFLSTAALQTTSLESWKISFETQLNWFKASLETNSFGDLNHELSLKGFNLELSYFKTTERAPVIQDLGTEVSGVTLNYTYL